MADNPPNIPNVPAGAVPPKKETGKVQPKKETVRITLPPKPSAAPTIKLPTLPPGGPTGAPSAATAAPIAATAAPRAAAAPVAQQQPRPAPAQRIATVAVPTLNPIDQILVIAAAVAALFAVGTVIWMWQIPTT
jgi:hypothetical protein